jgi:hypothetical protein
MNKKKIKNKNGEFWKRLNIVKNSNKKYVTQNYSFASRGMTHTGE